MPHRTAHPQAFPSSNAADTSTHPPAPAGRMQRVDELARHGRLLLLQGPNGPFFRRLTLRLRALGASVTRVNFNAGDDLFHPRSDALCYDGSHADWPAFLERVVREQDIRAIVLFGQDRAPHRAARTLGRRLGLPVVVFEEGYVRPCWVTMEEGGVNACSALAHSPMPTEPGPSHEAQKQRERFAWAFWAMAFYTGCYGLWGSLFRSRYPLYSHHKPLQCREGLYWLRATLRKLLYAVTQRGLRQRLAAPNAPRFFLVPLQIAQDSQILHHSPWPGNEPFIDQVVQSFAQHADAAEHLVFKHHPLEIGHAHYGAHVQRLAQAWGVQTRVHYVHGGHLPTLLARAKGVVLVNSTVGLQALHHGTPVFATGAALYARPELVSAGTMDAFWRSAQPPDAKTVQHFINHVILRTQVNASFYAPGGTWDWPARHDATHTGTPDLQPRPTVRVQQRAPDGLRAPSAVPAWLVKARQAPSRSAVPTPRATEALHAREPARLALTDQQ